MNSASDVFWKLFGNFQKTLLFSCVSSFSKVGGFLVSNDTTDNNEETKNFVSFCFKDFETHKNDD